MGLSLGSRILADVRVQGVSLRQNLGRYELIFGLYVTIRPTETQVQRASIVGARVTLDLGGGQKQSLGFARSESPFDIVSANHPSSMTPSLHLYLDAIQVANIEALREESDLGFELLANGVGSNVNGEHLVQDEWRITVARSDWIKKLRGSGAYEMMLIEVPLPVVEEVSDWNTISDGLLRAEAQYRNGDYRGCISLCRTVIEELGTYRYKNQNWANTSIDRLASDRKGMTKDEREAALWATLRHYTHQAHHGPSEGGVSQYSRAEAQFVLAWTAGAMAHYRMSN